MIAVALSKRFWEMRGHRAQPIPEHSQLSNQANVLKILNPCVFASTTEKILLWGKLGFNKLALLEHLQALRSGPLQY